MYASGADEATSVVVADVNGDGKPNLLVSNVFTEVYSDMNGAVGVLLGNGDGTFRAAVTYSSGGAEPRAVGVVDLNGDGKQDLVVSNNSSNTEGVLFGNGDGTFQAAVTCPS